MTKLEFLRGMVHREFSRGNYDEASKAGFALICEHYNQGRINMNCANDVYNLGSVYARMGHFERAAAMYADSANHVASLVGENMVFAWRITKLAQTLKRAGAHEPAFFILGHATQVMRTQIGYRNSTYAAALARHAQAAVDTGRISFALQAYRIVLLIRREHGARSEIVDTLHSMAMCHEKQRDYDEALRYAREALQMQTRSDFGYLASGNYLSELHEKNGEFTQANRINERMMKLALRNAGADHRIVLEFRYRRAHLLACRKKVAESIAAFEDLRADARDKFGIRSTFYADVVRAIGCLSLDNDNARLAIRYIAESIRINRSLNRRTYEDIIVWLRCHIRLRELDAAKHVLIYALMNTRDLEYGIENGINSIVKIIAAQEGPQATKFLTKLENLLRGTEIIRIIRAWLHWERVALVRPLADWIEPMPDAPPPLYEPFL